MSCPVPAAPAAPAVPAAPQVLLLIASERVHRMWCAMLGAAAMMGLLLWMNMAPSLGMVSGQPLAT